MKRLLKWGFRLVLLLVALVVLAVLSRNVVARPFVEKEIQRATGHTAILGRVSIGLTAPRLSVENLRLMNDAEFGGGVFVDVRELQVEYDWLALRSRTVQLRNVRVRVSQMEVVRNKDGRSNLRAFQEDVTQRLAASGSRTAGLQFGGLDVLTASLERIRLTDNLAPGMNREEWIGLRNGTVRNVKSWADLEPLFVPLTQQRHLQVLWDHIRNEVLRPTSPPAPRSVPVKSSP